MTAFLIFLVLGFIAYLFYKNFAKQIDSVSSAQHYTFEDMKFSTKDFYTLTEALVVSKEIPNVRTSRVEHAVHGLFSAKREYLRVTYKEYFFDICAAPFARDFFISWRQGELRQIQAGKRQYKTFYEQDTELMFKESIKLCLRRAIEQITQENGTRLLPEKDLAFLN